MGKLIKACKTDEQRERTLGTSSLRRLVVETLARNDFAFLGDTEKISRENNGFLKLN